jgi:hypothetical protein
MDRDVAERPFVHIPASSTFWGGWLTVSGVTAIGLISTGHPLAFLLALIFGFHAGFALKQLTREDPGLRITEEGVIDNSHWWHSGLIPWHEIVDIHASRWGMIEIKLRDENQFWQRLTALQQFAHIKTQLYGFSPALIVPWLLVGARGQIVEELQTGLDQYTLRSGAESPELPGRRPGPDLPTLPPR